MTTLQTFIAVTRFGLGAKPSELQSAAGDPRGWLKQQLQSGSTLPQRLAHFPTGSQRFAEFEASRRRSDAALQQALRGSIRESYIAEAGARTQVQIDSDTPFRERLVAFWSNHFTISVQRPPVLGLAGAFEREAIRPHVTGRFYDMLLAVARHPGMLLYLDNAQSVGPTSVAGQRSGRGLNENLAREILELHTLGVNAGYTQADVREFARILTGWSLSRPEDGDPGTFRFRPFIHEPGTKTLLGVQYLDGGIREGETALLALSRHPATATHIATKFARHFIADNPPAAAVKRLARVYRETDCDLGALARAIVDAPEAWAEPLAKVKTPNEYVVSALRATGYAGENEKLMQSLRLFGQAPFAAPSPAGWPDTAEQWIGPESVLRRAEWAMALGQRINQFRPPDTLVATTIAPVMRRETQLAIERAPSTAEAVALVFAAPEFQRR
ncbi:MAG: DUF1800 domain-containing protein [Proteobacteria bacterium]|nr:DUF1800 domain-containing protein [Pseudomonadota bacterium]